MRVAIVGNQAFSLINFRGSLMAELRRRGHEVFAFAPDFNEAHKTSLRALGVEPVDCAMTRSGMNVVTELATIFRLWRGFRRVRPDVSLGIFLKPVAYATIAGWLARVPRRYGLVAGLGFVFGIDAERTSGRRLLRSLVVSVLRIATSRINRVAFQNGDDYAQAIDLRLVNPDNSALIGATGVDLAEWRASPPPIEPVSFILVARLLREKGIVEYAEAAKLVKARYPVARFALLGGLDDNPSAITRAEIEQWTSEGIIEWHGHVAVKPWLEASSVFVLPSYYREGVPRSTQEAMAIGRPVITADTPGCRETVINGRNGFLVPPRDPNALASAMCYFLDNPDAIKSMGVESRELAEIRFNITEQNEKLISMMSL
jgi:glycosyltransferase involved in cell wall biosynthesis